MDKFLENLKFKVLGSYWVERVIAKRLEKAGFTVYRNFMVYDSREGIDEKNRYAEIDILAVDKTQVIICEAKSWAGQWYARDENKIKKWYKKGTRIKAKSPAWQVQRARKILLRVLLKDFFTENIRALDYIKTYVVLDRTEILNLDEPEIHKAWKKMGIKVEYLKNFVSPPCKGDIYPKMKPYLQAYKNHWQRHWYYKIVEKLGYRNKLLLIKQKQWEMKKSKYFL